MKVREELDRAADLATSVIGNAAGAVADPKTGLAKAKKSLMTPKAVLVLAAVVAGVVLLKRRR